MPLVVAQVFDRSRTIKPWYGCVVPLTTTLRDLFESFAQGSLDDSSPLPDEVLHAGIDVRVSKGPDEVGVLINPQCTIGDVSCVGQYVSFSLLRSQDQRRKSTEDQTSEESVQNKRTSAFNVLMASAKRTTCLPPVAASAQANKKVDLKNDLRALLEEKKLGWHWLWLNCSCPQTDY